MRFSKTLKKSVETRPVIADAERNRNTADPRPESDAAQFAVHELKFGRPNIVSSDETATRSEPAVSPPNIQAIGAVAETLNASPAAPSTEAGQQRVVKVSAANVHERLVAIREPDSSYAEDYRSLRTQLINKKNETGIRSVVILSFGPAEGKSITSINLAWLLAQTDGIRTALIDGDLRKPSLEDYLSIERQPGLSEVLRDGLQINDAMLLLEPAGLGLIQGGDARDEAAELLSSPKFKAIHDEVVSQFDFTIIDAPPLSLFTDAASILQVADAGILVVRSSEVNYQDLDRMLGTLPKEKLLAVVINQSEEALINRDYNYYSNYRNARD